MARARSVFALSALAVAATTVAACSPSVSSRAPRDPFASPIVPGQSARASSSAAGHGTIDAPTPRSGSGTVTVALVGGAQLPMETAQEFTKATGFTVAAVPVDGVGAAIQKYNEDNGYSVVRQFVGHGVGKNLHEDPEVPNYGKAGHGIRLVAGMVIAIEPMINMGTADIKTMPDGWTVKTKDGKWAAHFEHTIAVTPDGAVILTKV